MTWDITIAPLASNDLPTPGTEGQSQVERLARALYEHPVPQPLADGYIAEASALLRVLRAEDEATVHVVGDAVEGVIDWWTFKFASQRKVDAPPLPHSAAVAAAEIGDAEALVQ